MTVGILAIQGSIAEHASILETLGIDIIFVRSKEVLAQVTHLIIPGGESTTMTTLLEAYNMWDALQTRVDDQSIKIFGTCAGAILLSRLGMPIEAERNGYGAQQGSFSAPLDSATFPNLTGMFIRAPRFTASGSDATILATYQNEPVLLESDGMIASAFHPELCGETRIHAYFLGP